MTGSVAVFGVGAGALDLAEQVARSESVDAVTVYGRQKSVPEHTVFARELARYVYGLEPFSGATRAVFLAVPDESVVEIAHAISGQGPAPDMGCAAFHLSSVLPTEALSPLHGVGYELGSFHPLGSPARLTELPMRLTGSFIAVTGSRSAVAAARWVADAVDASVLEVPAGRRPLVDVATRLAAAYAKPVVDLSTRLMERAGIAADDALPALAAVARKALDEIEAGATAAATLHPVIEGDREAVSLHLRALDPEDQRLYAILALEALRLDGEGLDPETREAMHELLTRYTALEATSIG